ncbi:MAG TPA: hypothetical protein VF173_13525 [Thermoanaerobaculia bacterium]|nr:hypothetical protein [Thermoanaerobaculia bacterium]
MINPRSASLTALSLGKTLATSASRTTTLVAAAIRLAYLPRTKVPKSERSYSGLNSSTVLDLSFLIAGISRRFSVLTFELYGVFHGLGIDHVPAGHRLNGALGLERPGQHAGRNGLRIDDGLAERSLWIDDDAAVRSKGPPANRLVTERREFQALEKELLDDALEFVLALDKIEERLVSGLLDDLREDAAAVRLEAPGRERSWYYSTGSAAGCKAGFARVARRRCRARISPDTPQSRRIGRNVWRYAASPQIRRNFFRYNAISPDTLQNPRICCVSLDTPQSL